MDVSTDWVRVNAIRFADDLALRNIETGERHTWSALDDRVGRLAGVLVGVGVGVGDRVLLLADGDTRTFEVQFACMRLGAIMVSLNWRLSLPELIAIARDTQPVVVIHDGVWRDSAAQIADATGVRIRLSWRCENAELDYDAAVSDARYVEPRYDLPLDLPTHILHTSGTTGMPKGAITTSKTLIWQAFNTSSDAGLTGPGSTHLNPMPLFHAGGLITLSAPMLLTGGCVATMRRFDALTVLTLLTEPAQGITHFTAPPVMWLMLSQQREFNASEFHTLRYAQVAGGVPSLELLNRWQDKGVVLRQAYGGTEMGPAVTTMPACEALARPASCGHAVPFTHIRLVNEDGTEVNGRDVGEVWIKGPSVTPGYWRRDPATDDSFVNGWFRTGDAAWRDEANFYYLVDRKKDMFKSGGENVASLEVERVLALHAAVTDVAVIGVPHEKWGEVGKAFVVTRPGSNVTLNELRDHTAHHIARYKAPHHLVIVDELPRNATGKIAKDRLRELP